MMKIKMTELKYTENGKPKSITYADTINGGMDLAAIVLCSSLKLEYKESEKYKKDQLAKKNIDSPVEKLRLNAQKWRSKRKDLRHFGDEYDREEIESKLSKGFMVRVGAHLYELREITETTYA